MGSKTGLEAIEKTVIDRAVQKIYQPYFADPRPENMPILGDLMEALLAQGIPEADRVPGHYGPLAEGPRDAAYHQGLQDHAGRQAADFGAGVLAERHFALNRLRLQAMFPETQDRAAGKVLQSLFALSKGMGGGQAGGEVHRLRRRRGLPQRQGAAGRPGRPQVQQVVSPDGMGMGPGGLSAGH